MPAPVFAVVIVSSAWSQLLSQWPEISHWHPQVAQRFPLVLCIWAVIIISAVITAASGGSGLEWHVVLGTVQEGKGKGAGADVLNRQRGYRIPVLQPRC